jgi:CheY-like chemotaxis protein
MCDHESAIRIAFADDEPYVRTGLSRLLRQLGYDVACAAQDGAELIAFCNQQRVDVALVDLDMPVMDGLATAQELAAMSLPVVLISGHPDASHVVLEAEPVVTCILKPATAESLQEAIRTAIAQCAGCRDPVG